jgi:hypothetical protein
MVFSAVGALEHGNRRTALQVLMLLVQRLYVAEALGDDAAAASDGNSDCHPRLRAADAAVPKTRREGDAPPAAGRTDPVR